MIEAMPMGDIGEAGSTSTCRCRFCAPTSEHYTLTDLDYDRRAGPLRRGGETGGKLGSSRR